MILTEDDHDQMTASSKSRAANLHFSSKSIKMHKTIAKNIAIKRYQSSTYENTTEIYSEIICFQFPKVVPLHQQSKESFSCTGSQA